MGGEQSRPLGRNDGDFAEAEQNNNILAGALPTTILTKHFPTLWDDSLVSASCMDQGPTRVNDAALGARGSLPRDVGQWEKHHPSPTLSTRTHLKSKQTHALRGADSIIRHFVLPPLLTITLGLHFCLLHATQASRQFAATTARKVWRSEATLPSLSPQLGACEGVWA